MRVISGQLWLYLVSLLLLTTPGQIKDLNAQENDKIIEYPGGFVDVSWSSDSNALTFFSAATTPSLDDNLEGVVIDIDAWWDYDLLTEQLINQNTWPLQPDLSSSNLSNWQPIEFIYVSPNDRFSVFTSETDIQFMLGDLISGAFAPSGQSREFRFYPPDAISIHWGENSEAVAVERTSLGNTGLIFYADIQNPDDLLDTIVYEFDTVQGISYSVSKQDGDRLYDVSETGDIVLLTARERIVGQPIYNSPQRIILWNPTNNADTEILPPDLFPAFLVVDIAFSTANPDSILVLHSQQGLLEYNYITGQMRTIDSSLIEANGYFSPDAHWLALFEADQIRIIELETSLAVPSLSINSITVINADTDTAVSPLNDGDVLVLDDLPANFNFNLDATASGSFNSIDFIGGQFGATTNYTVRTEDNAPYAWLGDVSGNYNGQPLTVGSYNIVVTPYSGFGASGEAGTPTRIRFKVIQSAGDPLPSDPVVGSIANFNLIDADTNTVIRTLTSGETLALDDPTMPTNFNVEAVVTDPVGHIRFEGNYDDGSTIESISDSEFIAPFSWFGDDYNDGGAVGYLGRSLQIGTYSFTATPYLLIEDAGEMGTPVTFGFDVVATTPMQCDLNATNGATLITAIDDANTNGTADTICLADGTYTLTASNVIDYGDNGLPLITSDITLVGLGDNVVIERGVGAPAFRLLHVKDTGTLTLENLTLSNGNAGITHGGAVYARGALTLRDVTITGNFARRGGGVRMNGAPLTVTGSTFQNNSADREGGAIYVSGINSPVDVSTSQFTANSATNSGGGFYLSGTSTSLTANDVVFTGNQANGGGAIYAVPSTLNITNATFTSNEALVSSGGAIYTSSDSSVAVANSTFTTNEAGSDGGALRSGGNLTLTGSTLTSNVAQVGAAVFSQNATTIMGNRIELNVASELGGGLYVSHNGNTHSITGNCISGNTAPQFSGLLGVTANTNATDNWWGATDGPVSGNTVSANVIFTPFLSACPLD